MLKILIPAINDGWDNAKQEFVQTKEQILCLEHSLVSISKWESRWHKPFLADKDKTIEETIDYIRCMTLTQNVDSDVYRALTDENISQVNAYISDPMTATTFSKRVGGTSHEIVTSELIYYWMIALNIPIKCEKWHLNRLLTLIEVCNRKNEPPKKMGEQELMSRNRKLNEQRKAAMNTRG